VNNLKIDLGLDVESLTVNELTGLIIDCAKETERRLTAPPTKKNELKNKTYDYAQGENRKLLMDFIKVHLDMPAKEIQSELQKQGKLFKIQTIYNTKYFVRGGKYPTKNKNNIWKQNPLAKPVYED